MKKSEINVLIIEDDKTFREVLGEMVKRKGYRVVAVAKPEEAESIVKIKPIHALIADVMLPGINGVDLVLKLKGNLPEDVAIVFISGIYRDRGFAHEAIQKTGALEFFTKPFDNAKLFDVLEKKLKAYLEAPKLDLHTLLATPYASNRERRKALDHVEEMKGYDLPFVFSILMDAQSSGHLNIVDEDQNIFGVTFAKGAISNFDSESTTLQTKKLLIQHGFITERELGELKGKPSGSDLIKSLVEEGLMSPHVPGLIKAETILNGLSRVVNDKRININFVTDRQVESLSDDMDIEGFVQPLHEILDKELPLEWLKGFYSVWVGHAIHKGPEFANHVKYLGLPIMKNVEGLILCIKEDVTIEEVIAKCPQFTEENIYKALHFLMLRRVYVFEEAKKVKNIDEHVGRLQSIYSELKDKNPFEIFMYFGLSSNPKAEDVIRIYKEFAKSHHPDTLPKAVSEEIRAMNHTLFSKVTEAYEILSDKEKKEKFLNELKQKEAERQIKSDDLVTQGSQLLSRGRYSEALSLLESAIKLYRSENSMLHYWWAQLKTSPQISPEELSEIEKRLRETSPGMRKTVLWVFVSGLIKKAKGDIAGAAGEFSKALQIDNKFMDARRELSLLKSQAPVKLTAGDILTGDLSTVLKGLFKRKKGA